MKHALMPTHRRETVCGVKRKAVVDTTFDWALLCEKDNQALRAEIANADYVQCNSSNLIGQYSLAKGWVIPVKAGQ